jgi:hypothetical protein
MAAVKTAVTNNLLGILQATRRRGKPKRGHSVDGTHYFDFNRCTRLVWRCVRVMKSNTNKGAGIPVVFSRATGCELPRRKVLRD